MKKKLLIALVALLVAAFTLGMTAAFADDQKPWAPADSNVTLTGGSEKVARFTGTAGVSNKVTYKDTVNLNEGASFEFVIAQAGYIDIDPDARANGSNYLLATALTPEGIGVQFKIYALYSKNATTNVNKMQCDVYLLNPAYKAEEGKLYSDGIRYLESFDTYTVIEDQRHVIDIHKEEDMWFFAFDGLTAIPSREIKMDLSDCTLTFEFYTKEKTPQFSVYDVQPGIQKHYIENGLIQFGSDIITYNSDDTVKYRIADQRAAQFPGSELRYREHLISAKGFDVRKPINIEYSYDVSNASAVWYAVGLGRPNVLDSITRMQFDVFNKDGKGVANGVSSFSDSIAAENDGIMFQTTTGLAQPTYRPQNNRKESYLTNSASKPYENRSNMDIITFIVGEDGTDMYHNGKLIFDGLVTKLSDFEASGYMAYPYFHFFEDNASTAKGNTIVVKGFNAARRTDDEALKVVGDSGEDITVGIENYENGAITLWEPDGNGGMTAVSSDLYRYDESAKAITIKYEWFEGKAYDVYQLYARNDGGSEEISIRFSDPGLVTQPPTVDKDTYYWKVGAGTEDLVVNIDIKNGIWASFSGGGILAANYTYTPGETDGKGTITISKDFLNNKKEGTFTFTVRTKNIEEETFSVQFKIVVNATGAEETTPPDDGKDPENPPESGCGSFLGVSSVLALGLVAGAAIALRKKK